MAQLDAGPLRRYTDVEAREILGRAPLDAGELSDLVEACDGVAAAVEASARLLQTMAPARVITAVTEKGLKEIAGAVEQAVESVPGYEALVATAWTGLSLELRDVAKLGDVEGAEPEAALWLSEWLERGLICEASVPRTFRVAHPVAATVRQSSDEELILAAAELVSDRLSDAQRRLWTEDGARALARMRSFERWGAPLVAALRDQKEVELLAGLIGNLVAEPFADLPRISMVDDLRDLPVDPADTRFRCALVLADVFRGTVNDDQLITLAVDAADAGDDLTLTRIVGQLAIVKAERRVELPPEVELDTVAERVDDERYRAFLLVRDASMSLARGLAREARGKLEDALALIDEHQVVLLEGYARNRLSQCWFLEGHSEQARRGFEGALEIHRKLGQTGSVIRDGIDLAGTLIELGDTDDALEVLDEAAELARREDSHRLRLAAILLRGMTHHAAERFAPAEADLQTAAALAERIGDLRMRAAALSHLGQLHIERDDWEGATEKLRPALESATRLGSVYLEATILLLTVPAALVRGDADASAMVGRLHEIIADGSFRFIEPAVEVLDELRVAWRTGDRSRLDEALGRLGDTTEDEMARVACEHAWRARRDHEHGVPLVVHRDGLWFEGPDGLVDLRRRKAPRRLLVALASARDDSAGVLTMDELFESAWEDESATAESAAQRVYTAIWTLRKMGLEGLLEKRTEGYLFSEEVRIVWSADATVPDG